MNIAERSHEITRTYAYWAARLDEYLDFERPIANWFHFATWGTWTVGHVIRSSMGTPMAEHLARAQNRIFDDVIAEAENFVDGHLPISDNDAVGSGFNCYRLARRFRRDFHPSELMARGTNHIVAYEQALIDGDLAEAFEGVGYYTPEMLTKMLSVAFPLGELKLGEDVPGYPGTAATDWRDLLQRLRWTRAACVALQEDESLHSSPYEIGAEFV